MKGVFVHILLLVHVHVISDHSRKEEYPLTHKICRVQTKSANQDQTQQNAASDQSLHCLLTEYSIKI